MTTIFFPNILDDRGAAEFSNKVLMSMAEPELIFDFGELDFVEPFGIMLAAQALRHAVMKRHKDNSNLGVHFLNATDDDGKPRPSVNRLILFNFFGHVNWSICEKEKTKKPELEYIPIIKITKSDIEAMKEGNFIDNVKKYSNFLSKMLFDSNQKKEIDIIGYFFSEIISNVFRHSRTDKCYVIAQKWRKDSVDIVISDEGVGIIESLSKIYGIKDNIMAIRKSLQFGISKDLTSATKNKKPGTGLFSISEIGKKMGGFSIFSKDDLLVFEGHHFSMFRLPMVGTIVKVSVDLSNSDSFFAKLEGVIAEGERLASK